VHNSALGKHAYHEMQICVILKRFCLPVALIFKLLVTLALKNIHADFVTLDVFLFAFESYKPLRNRQTDLEMRGRAIPVMRPIKTTRPYSNNTDYSKLHRHFNLYLSGDLDAFEQAEERDKPGQDQ